MISRKNRALALVLAVLGQQAFAAQKPKYAYEIFIDKNINHDLSADKRVDKVFVQTYTREKRFADLMNKLKITDKTLKIVNKGIPVVEVGGKIVAYGLGQPEVAGAVSKVSKGIGQVAGVGVKIAKKALTSQYTAEQHKSKC